MYSSNPLDSAYGNPGFFVRRADGVVRDTSGATVPLVSALDEKHVRRLCVCTANLPPPSADGVYEAQIRRAKNVRGIRISHASVPRRLSRVTAQLVLYSVPIRGVFDDATLVTTKAKMILQRFCRHQLLSQDTSDFPFFTPASSSDDGQGANFDWRDPDAIPVWSASRERNTSIASMLENEYANHLVDVDTLTVRVPVDCNLLELGEAFRQCLESHSGKAGDRQTSLWNRYRIATTDSGFSVREDVSEADGYNTFAAVTRDDDRGGSLLEPMKTPIRIVMTKSRPVYVDERAFDGAVNTPDDISSTHARLREFTPTAVAAGAGGGDGAPPVTYEVWIDDAAGGAGASSGLHRDVYALHFPDDVDSDDILEVLHTTLRDDGTAEQRPAPLRPVTMTFQKRRDVRLGLRWEGHSETQDFFIDANDVYESRRSSAADGSWRRDVQTVSSLSSSSAAPTASTYNDVRTLSELQDTYVPAAMHRAELHHIREVNDAHRLQQMLFAGHMMNVAEPAPMPAAGAALPHPQPPAEWSRPRASGGVPASEARFYDLGLGWQTAIADAPTRFVMHAFPVRWTQRDGADATPSASIYGESLRTSVSPLVARILSGTGPDGAARPFYDVEAHALAADAAALEAGGRRILADAEIAAIRQRLIAAAADPPAPPAAYRSLYTYVPRVYDGNERSNAIVVTIGGENYVVRSARLISVLANHTPYALDLSCDRHAHSRPAVLSSEPAIRAHGGAHGGAAASAAASAAAADARRRAFFEYVGDQDAPSIFENAKYFAWCFELDRPVRLGVGGVACDDAARAALPDAATMPLLAPLGREFLGLSDPACMLVPGVYHEDTGRPAASRTQPAPHAFHVRAGSAVYDQVFVVLHDVGHIESPTNASTASGRAISGHVMALLDKDADQRKPLTLCCSAATWFRSPRALDALRISFVSSRTGKPVDIGLGNAVVLFDIYCENE